uniref:(northern house mosquito) hypothetical protein n=1 Tax=Culex pipiens TaxID=7175 RepID=A0A8D8B9F6_CULPI
MAAPAALPTNPRNPSGSSVNPRRAPSCPEVAPAKLRTEAPTTKNTNANGFCWENLPPQRPRTVRRASSRPSCRTRCRTLSALRRRWPSRKIPTVTRRRRTRTVPRTSMPSWTSTGRR